MSTTSVESLNLDMKRKDGEDFQEYKVRRKLMNTILKKRAEGRMFHESIKIEEIKYYDKEADDTKVKYHRTPQTYKKESE